MDGTGEVRAGREGAAAVTAPARALTVVWIVHGKVREEGGRAVSDFASVRYRTCVPGPLLARRGHDVKVVPVTDAAASAAAAELPADVFILAKSFLRDNEALARRVKSRGIPLVVDLCDNHFDHPALGAHQRALVEMADVLAVATPAMGQVLLAETGRDALVVPDPYEGPGRAPRFAPDPQGRLRVLWFGHPLNLDTVTAALPSLYSVGSRHPIDLRIVTAPLKDLVERFRGLNAAHGDRVRIEVVPWSIETTWRELDACDLVIIPSLDEHARKKVKSPNRVVETLRAGRLAVAHPLPSYLEFEPFCSITRDLGEGIDDALASPGRVAEAIRAGQDYIELQFSPDRAAEAWDRVVRIAARPGPSTAAARPARATAPLRLNVGCGDKILPGYVNVDIVEGRLGRKPDVICDVRKLEPFADDTADEVLAVHVVEHIWRWEVVGVLREWVRVLRPGGRMVVECPNLLSACQQLLADPERGSGPGTEGERTMWVFYGDPRWKDPYMCHRWGYTPQSLAAIMREAGLVNVRQEPAQFKMREPRDMRVVGEKPTP